MSTIASMPSIAVQAARAPRPVATDADRDGSAGHHGADANLGKRARPAAAELPAPAAEPGRPTATLGNRLDALA
jgi:hypothetical protein